MTVRKAVCPLDCHAHCGLLVDVEDGVIKRIKGDPSHPWTKGVVCSKVSRHIDRLYSADRILHPLLRTGDGWRRMSWDEAYDQVAAKIQQIRSRYGGTALMHHDGGGFEGLLSGMARRFCNALGEITIPEGNYCLGSAVAAQTYDFGAKSMHDWADLENSRCITLWGRDPSISNVHLVGHIRRAMGKGASLLVINPIHIELAKTATIHLMPRPGTDGALALAMAHVIIKEGLEDRDFINRHVYGYEEFLSLVETYTPGYASESCGIPPETIEEAARLYGTSVPASIVMGYGLQRYVNGGQTIRAIDALSAITGNIGVEGGGANLAHKGWEGILGDIEGNHLPRAVRRLPWPRLGSSILEAQDPPVKAMIVTCSNPVDQLADTSRMIEAFQSLEFCLVVDFFMTSTAEMADILLPAAGLFEKEDITYSSWNPYLGYLPKLIEPLGDVRADADIFCDLAERMGLEGFGSFDPGVHLAEALETAHKYGISMDLVKDGPVRHPSVGPVAWADHDFPTPTGKIELYSTKALEDGVNPLPDYVPAAGSSQARDYPLYLITPHRKETLNSQFWNLLGEHTMVVHIPREAAAERGIKDGDMVEVCTLRGRVSGAARVSDQGRADIVRIYQGGWHNHGTGVNILTAECVPDMGQGVPFYDCMCDILKAPG